jgi:RNA polymerase sigma factor (sigma-70 family)
MDAAATLSVEQFVERYRKLAGYIAWTFVRRSHREISPVVLTQEDAEDFASCALLKLVKCPPDKYDQKPYVNLLIVNAIITAWRKRLKQINAETNPESGHVTHRMTHRKGNPMRRDADRTVIDTSGSFFDTLDGHDRGHENSDTQFDFTKAIKFLPDLPHAERLVIELNFGLGCPPCGVERIGKKLGRSKTWVELRISRGILRIREQLSSQQQTQPV